jgi:hypothetical protein
MATEKLWCKTGQHFWDRELKRGRKPDICPEHIEGEPALAPVEQPQPVHAEEQKARLAKNLEKARLAKRSNADSAIWKSVQSRINVFNCKCDLRPGMRLEELMPPNMPGSGCTDKWVCPALDAYRRMLGH